MAARNRKHIRPWAAEEVEREPPRACPVSGKRMYATEREARATASHRMADTQTGPAQLRTYKCMYCAAWHLTSKQA